MSIYFNNRNVSAVATTMRPPDHTLFTDVYVSRVVANGTQVYADSLQKEMFVPIHHTGSTPGAITYLANTTLPMVVFAKASQDGAACSGVILPMTGTSHREIGVYAPSGSASVYRTIFTASSLSPSQAGYIDLVQAAGCASSKFASDCPDVWQYPRSGRLETPPRNMNTTSYTWMPTQTGPALATMFPHSWWSPPTDCIYIYNVSATFSGQLVLSGINDTVMLTDYPISVSNVQITTSRASGSTIFSFAGGNIGSIYSVPSGYNYRGTTVRTLISTSIKIKVKSVCGTPPLAQHYFSQAAHTRRELSATNTLRYLRNSTTRRCA